MGKHDRLIQKIELFERLAVYGDRESFLQRLAQANNLTPQMKQMLESTLKNVTSVGGQVPGVAQFQGPLMDALNSENPNMTALQNALQHISTQFVGKFGPNDPRAQQAQQLFGMTQSQAPAAAPAQSFGPPSSLAPNQKKQKLTPIDPGVQKVLGVTPDGWMGDETRAALAKYKQSKDPSMTDAEAMVALKGDPRYQEFAPDLGPAQERLRQQTLNPQGNPEVPNAEEAARADQERARGGNPLRNAPRYTPKT